VPKTKRNTIKDCYKHVAEPANRLVILKASGLNNEQQSLQPHCTLAVTTIS